MGIMNRLAALAAIVAVACGNDLGDCEREAATELVYSESGQVAVKGQALIHDSCGHGEVCHASTAQGATRYGAPVGVDFDMLPSPSGWPNLVSRRVDAWDEVESGHMPPSGAGRMATTNSQWVFDLDRNPDRAKLPALDTQEGKAAVRNWLACGAPLVVATAVPQWAMPSGSAGDGGVSEGFEGIYTDILKVSCATVGCHNNASAAGGIKYLDACGSYAELTKAGICGAPWVKAGDAKSPLLELITSRTPKCGQVMPPAPAALLAPAKIATIRKWIEDGAKAPKCN
jgi:hypothetical protein